MTNTYIQTGNRIRVYDSAVAAHATLPLGTYRVHFNPKEGFSLARLADLTVGSERVYGDRKDKVDKLFRSYKRTDRSLGVMLSGDKGQGKTLFLRMVAERAHELELPVVLVTEDADGIADFIDTLDECIVVFDEFEKTFSGGPRGRTASEAGNRQNQFLSLFDGLSVTKRIYLLTVNEVADVSTYIVNRPGRFLYHIRFDYPGPDEVREYLSDQAPLAPAAEIEAAVLLSRRINLNFDHLRAIAFELNDPMALFSDIIRDLNIKAIEPSLYRIDAFLESGKKLTGEGAFSLFERGEVCRDVTLRDANRDLDFSFRPADLDFQENGTINVPITAIELSDDDDLEDMPTAVTLTLVGQADYAFAV